MWTSCERSCQRLVYVTQERFDRFRIASLFTQLLIHLFVGKMLFQHRCFSAERQCLGDEPAGLGTGILASGRADKQDGLAGTCHGVERGGRFPILGIAAEHAIVETRVRGLHDAHDIERGAVESHGAQPRC